MAISGTLVKTGRGVSGSAFFSGGMNSAPPAMFIDDRSYRHAENVVHRGGIARTRPGYREIFKLPDDNLQGLSFFRPIGGEGHLAFAVNGNVYLSSYPFASYAPLVGLSDTARMYEHAERVWFCSAVRSAQRNPDGTVTAIEPRRMLMVQDNAYTRCGYWDGVTAAHIDPTVVTDGAGNILTAGTPLGSAMAWSGDRLWVANGNKVFASDICDPLSFVENEYLAEGGFFLFDDDVTALVDVPSSNIPVLFVFTKNRTYILKSGIRDRASWKTTDNFQSVVFPEVGCVSARSIVSRNGQLWWMSVAGLTNFNSAHSAQVSSKLVPADVPMLVSKANIDANFSRVALGSYENFLLCSVPYGDKYNSHTWVYDQGVMGEKENVESWSGVWTGTRPVEWASGLFGDTPRVYYVSKDIDGHNRLWEAFVPDRKDAEEEIACFFESKTHIDFSEKATGLDRKRFAYAEVTLSEVQGDVDLEILYAGTRGKYKSLGEWHITATEGSPAGGVSSSAYTTYRPQQRIIRTPSVNEGTSPACTSCNVESNRQDWIDVGFSLLVKWTGRAGVASYRIYADPVEEQSAGEATFTETGPRILSGAECS